MEIGLSSKIIWQIGRDRLELGKPVYVDLRTEMNCMRAISVCPEWGEVGCAKLVGV